MSDLPFTATKTSFNFCKPHFRLFQNHTFVSSKTTPSFLFLKTKPQTHTQCCTTTTTTNNNIVDIDMVKTKQGTYVPKQNKVVVLWDLDNKPPRGPPYDAALSLKTLAERFGELTDISAYANRPKSSTSSLRCHHHRSTMLSSPSPTAISNNSPAHTFYLATPIAPNVSLARQNFNNDSEAAINEQINVEYNVSYVYHSLFAFFFYRDNTTLKGLAKFFKESSEEEREHAEKLMKYQNLRGGSAVVNFWHG